MLADLKLLVYSIMGEWYRNFATVPEAIRTVRKSAVRMIFSILSFFVLVVLTLALPIIALVVIFKILFGDNRFR